MTEPLLHLSPESLSTVSGSLATVSELVGDCARRTVGVDGLPGSATRLRATDLSAAWTDHVRGRADLVQRYSHLAASQATSLAAEDSDLGAVFRGGGR